jgi:hypothetical protein
MPPVTVGKIAARRHLLLPFAAALALLAIAILAGGGEPVPQARAALVPAPTAAQRLGCAATP